VVIDCFSGAINFGISPQSVAKVFFRSFAQNSGLRFFGGVSLKAEPNCCFFSELTDVFFGGGGEVPKVYPWQSFVAPTSFLELY
jgi:hypothetical protein